MRITRKQLRQMIQEELGRELSESGHHLRAGQAIDATARFLGLEANAYRAAIAEAEILLAQGYTREQIARALAQRDLDQSILPHPRHHGSC